MTPEQAALIEQAERLDSELPSPRYRKAPMCGHIRCDCPVREVHLGESAFLHAYVMDEANDLKRDKQETRLAAQVHKVLELLPALAAELKRALDENARIKAHAGMVLDIIATRLELNPPISDDEQIDLEAVARWVKAIGAEHINALVTERDALRARLANCEPVVELVRALKETPPWADDSETVSRLKKCKLPEVTL